MSTTDNGSESDSYYYDDFPWDDSNLPLVELRASVHNMIFNHDIFINLPLKVQKRVVSFLPKSDAKDCRLVSRNWNSVLVKCLYFTAELSDLSRYSFLKLRSLEKLIIDKMVTRNLSKIPNPLNPREILKNFRMNSCHDVKTLVFREGTEQECQLKILSSYRWIEKLVFQRVPFPTFFPSNLSLPYLKWLEINTRHYYHTENLTVKTKNDDTIYKFFKTVHIPTLENFKLVFHARNDILNYLGAHYFAAAHYKTLKKLSLNFGYHLSDVDAFSKEELNPSSSLDIRKKRFAAQALEMKKEKEIDRLKLLLPLMSLETLDLSLSLNEGHAPWTLSFKLIDAQKHLKILDVQYPSILKNFSFSTVIQNNHHILNKISIPCLINFDCSVLTKCQKLCTFSIGREFSFNYLFFGNRGSLQKFSTFPALHTLHSVSICVPLSKVEILWLSSAIPCHSLLVYGTEHEFFSVDEVIGIISERGVNLKKLMMRVYMTDQCSESLSKYFERNDHLSVTDYFHTSECGFTTFVVEKNWEDNLVMMTMMDDYGYSETFGGYDDDRSMASIQSMGGQKQQQKFGFGISVGLQADF